MGTNKLKILSPDKYNSERRLEPKDEGTKKLYFKIYEEYVLGHLSEKELADKYDYSISHISRIIKWVVTELGEPDSSVQLRSMIDGLRLRQQDIEMTLSKAEKIKDKVALWRELRQIDRLIAQLQGLLTPITIDMSDRRQVTVITNTLHRREGVEEKKD